MSDVWAQLESASESYRRLPRAVQRAAQGDADAQIIAAQAQAEANAKISASMSPQLAQLEAIRACADALAKTQAKIASCGGMGSGGGGTNVITIPAG